jgi:hypothetical protein
MSEKHLETRIDARLRQQQDRQLGAKLREEALDRLTEQHGDLPAVKFESWKNLLESEMADPTPGISAGAAALAMMDVRDDRRRKRSKHRFKEDMKFESP